MKWLYGMFESRLHASMTESKDYDTWMLNVARLLPSLLLKSLVPLHDSASVHSPEIVIAQYAPRGGPHAFYRPGTATRTSTFIRNLFLKEEIHGLAQAGQRMAELLAHTLPLLLIEQRPQELANRHARILEMAAIGGRLRALQHLETLYRYKLQVPTWLYTQLRTELMHS